MASIPVHFLILNSSCETQFRNAGPGRMTSGGHQFCDGSQHPVDAGFEPTETKRRRNGAETAARPCGNYNWQRPLHLFHLSFFFHLSSFILHRIFLRQRHHGLNGASLLSKSSLHIIFYPAAGRH